MDNKQFFFCYDANLSKFLKFNKGMRYILKAINPSSNKMFWLYWQSAELTKAIDEFFKGEKNVQSCTENNFTCNVAQ